MLLRNYNPNGQSQRIEVQMSTSALLIETTLDIGQQPHVNYGESAACVGTWFSAFMNHVITISKYSSTGTKVLFQSIPLAALAEIAAFGKSQITHTFNGTVMKTQFYIFLSNTSALWCDKSEFIIYEAVGGNIANASVSVSAIGSYASSNNYLKLDSISCLANQPVNMDVTSSYFLAVNTEVLKATLTSSSGDQIILDENEVFSVTTMNTDFVHLINGMSVPSVNWKCIDVALAVRAELIASSNTQFYLLTNK